MLVRAVPDPFYLPVLGVLVLPAAAGVPLGPLIAVGRKPTAILEHASRVQEVVSHERGVAICEVVIESQTVVSV